MKSLAVLGWWFSRFTAGLIRVVRGTMFVLLLYLVLAINAIIVLRVLGRISLPWITDSAQLLAPWLAVMAAADAFSRGTHPAMEFLLKKLPGAHMRLLRIGIQVLTLVILGLLCLASWNYAKMGHAITITSMDSLTLFPFYLSLPVGFACMFIITLDRTLHLVEEPDLIGEGAR